uniref:DUF4774 domain-containing protein n=1 Tax=Heterorhabditis bacteriophora TaxID=37862 RepID=A0A1I7XV70_HETBA
MKLDEVCPHMCGSGSSNKSSTYRVLVKLLLPLHLKTPSKPAGETPAPSGGYEGGAGETPAATPSQVPSKPGKQNVPTKVSAPGTSPEEENGAGVAVLIPNNAADLGYSGKQTEQAASSYVSIGSNQGELSYPQLSNIPYLFIPIEAVDTENQIYPGVSYVLVPGESQDQYGSLFSKL